MPVVFVHGVNTRHNAAYRAGVEVRKALFIKHLAGAKIGGKSFNDVVDPVFPMWGDLATTFAWNMASLPHGEMQSLGGDGDTALRPYLAAVSDALAQSVSSEPLLDLAMRDFPQAVELISSLAIDQATEGQEAEVAEFVLAAQAYAAENPTPPWLANLTTDDQLLGNLNLAITQRGGVQAQGISDVVNTIKTAATKLKTAATGLVGSAANKAGDYASSKLLGWTRDGLNANLGRFFGDIFIYFNGRGDAAAPGPIPQRVLAGYDQAVAGAAPNEPLVIVGHSLGGVISFDLISHFRPDLEVDLFVSVGSQVAHFEEMKLFKGSDEGVKPPNKAKTPDNIKHWINVYDEVDIFAYACNDVFDRVDLDVRYDTQTYVIKSHGEYFQQERFYERLRARIDELP
jgi:hypothetical protein